MSHRTNFIITAFQNKTLPNQTLPGRARPCPAVPGPNRAGHANHCPALPCQEIVSTLIQKPCIASPGPAWPRPAPPRSVLISLDLLLDLVAKDFQILRALNANADLPLADVADHDANVLADPDSFIPMATENEHCTSSMRKRNPVRRLPRW